MGKKENDQKPPFERILAKLYPKIAFFWARFSPKYRPIQMLMLTMSSKLHQWLKN
jgi:hypothetical protein